MQSGLEGVTKGSYIELQVYLNPKLGTYLLRFPFDPQKLTKYTC